MLNQYFGGDLSSSSESVALSPAVAKELARREGFLVMAMRSAAASPDRLAPLPQASAALIAPPRFPG